MKTLRQLSLATIFSLMLAVSVFAGQIETTGAPAVSDPPPTTTSTSTSTTNVITSILLTIVGLT